MGEMAAAQYVAPAAPVIYAQPAPVTYAGKTFDQLDLDRNGVITRSEMAAAQYVAPAAPVIYAQPAPVTPITYTQPAPVTYAGKTFDQLDRDGNGVITRSEMAA